MRRDAPVRRVGFLLLAALPAIAAGRERITADVLVHGATPAGVAAALNAASLGHTVVLTEETGRIGGLLTGGLSYTDFRAPESVQGAFRDYMERVVAYYRRTAGDGSPQVDECFDGAHAEPRVSLAVLSRMLAAQPRVRLLHRHLLGRVLSRHDRIEWAEFAREPSGDAVLVQARLFIDATYEGDLAAAAGAAYRVGREGVAEYGERLAGHIFFRRGALLYGGTGEGDRAIQCYNFRVILTERESNRLPIGRPSAYSRQPYTPLVPLFRNGVLQRAFSEDHSGVLRLQRIPNGKSDFNDINVSPVGFGLPGRNWQYPEGSRAVRRQIFDEHRQHALGLLYFLQNEAELPPAVRAEAQRWGLPRDEFEESGHFPPQLYVREGRRIVGRTTFTQHDVELQRGTARARLHRDAVAIADYPLNSHGVAPAGAVYDNVREGYFVYGDLPYQVPYGVIVPKTIGNLLVPVAVSASHVGYSAVRMEPTWTALGQAAGVAAHLALTRNLAVGDVPVAALQRLLHARGAATFFFSDIPRTHPRFALLQRLGCLGFFHEPVGNDFQLTPRRLRRPIQYYYSPERHAADLAAPLSPATATLWRGLAEREGWTAPPFRPGMTRGAYLDELALRNGL